tara:strand:- start:375 stop:710 length:336 start_codon:yes stop_codon:yes gene_type:complete
MGIYYHLKDDVDQSLVIGVRGFFNGIDFGYDKLSNVSWGFRKDHSAVMFVKRRIQFCLNVPRDLTFHVGQEILENVRRHFEPIAYLVDADYSPGSSQADYDFGDLPKWEVV